MLYCLFRFSPANCPRTLAFICLSLMLTLMLTWNNPAALAAPPQVILRAGHDAPVSQVLFSPDGGTVATLGDDRTVVLWDARTGARRAHWQPEGHYPNQIAFAPDGGLLAVGSITGTLGQTSSTLTLLDPRTGAVRQTLTVTPSGQPDMVSFAWSPDSKALAVARRTAPATLWDVALGTVRTTLPAETTGASSIVFSPAGLVITRFDAPPHRRPGAEPAPARLPLAWDAGTGAPATLPVPLALPADLAALTTLATGPQGRLVLGDMERQDVEFRGRVMPGLRIVSTTPVFWNPATGKSARGAKVAGALIGVQWSKDGTRVAAAHRDALLLFDPATGATVATLPTGQFTNAIALAPGGETVAAGEEDGTVAVFSAATHTALWRAPGRTTGLLAMAVSPDGSRLISAHADGTLALWDLHAGKLVKAVRLPDFKLVTLAWSPDGTTLATSQARQHLTATMMDNGVPPADVRLWDLPALTVRKVIPGTDPRYAWSALAFSPDGSLLAGVHNAGGMHARGTAGDSDPAVLWDPKTGVVKQSLDGSFASPQALVFAPKGGLLALGDRNTFDVYDAPGYARRPNVAPNEGGFTALAFAPDGQTLITGSENGRVRFWPMTGTDQERRQGRYGLDPKTKLAAGDGSLAGLSVSLDGSTVASGGADKTVRLWTVATGALTATLPAQDAPVTALRYAPDGLLVSGGADGAIRVWDPKAQSLRATLTLLPSATPLPVPPVSQPGDPVTNPDGSSPPTPVPAEMNWIAWTPQGYYQASPGAGPFVDWQQDGQSLSPDVRRARWNQPAQIQSALTAAPKP